VATAVAGFAAEDTAALAAAVPVLNRLCEGLYRELSEAR
jgi:hypothetical protein